MTAIDRGLRAAAFSGPDGNRLAADIGGPEDGVPVVLAHGTGQSRHSWGAIAEALGARGLRAIAYDLRGHGDSDRTGHYSVAAHAGDLRAVLAAAGGPAILVGASLGGVAMLDLLGDAARPATARALVLIDIGHRIATGGPARIDGFMAGTVGGFDSLEEAAAAIARYLPHREPRRPGGGLLKTLERRDDGRYYWRWDPAMLAGRQPLDLAAYERKVAADLRRVTVPTLVVRGANSEILTRETAEEMLDILPDGRLVEVAGAHHMVAGDDNNAFMAALLAFIDALDPE